MPQQPGTAQAPRATPIPSPVGTTPESPCRALAVEGRDTSDRGAGNHQEHEVPRRRTSRPTPALQPVRRRLGSDPASAARHPRRRRERPLELTTFRRRRRRAAGAPHGARRWRAFTSGAARRAGPVEIAPDVDPRSSRCVRTADFSIALAVEDVLAGQGRGLPAAGIVLIEGHWYWASEVTGGASDEGWGWCFFAEPTATSTCCDRTAWSNQGSA